MNVPATQRPTVEIYAAKVLPPGDDLYQSLPAHIKPAVFERNLMNAIFANPDLMHYPPRLVYREVAKAAGLGLLLDPLLGEAYIVTAYNYKTKAKEPQLRVGYKGMAKLARQSGDVANLYAHEIYSLDQVEADLGHPKVLHVRPKLFGNRGDLIGYIAVIAFKDSTFDFEPMSKQECLAIRDRSDAWKAHQQGLIKSTPWQTDEIEMSKKTVLRRLLKRQNQSPEMVRAIQIEDEAEFPHLVQDRAPPARRVPPSAPPPALPPGAQAGGQAEPNPDQNKAPEQEQEQQDQPKTLAQWLAEIPAIKTRKAAAEWRDGNKAVFDQLPDGEYNKIAETFKAHLATLPKPGPKPKAGPAEKPQEAEQQKPSDSISSGPAVSQPSITEAYEDWLKWAETTMQKTDSADVLEVFFNQFIEPQRSQIMPPDFDDLLAAYQARDKALTSQ